jgi:hypothetical protein
MTQTGDALREMIARELTGARQAVTASQPPSGSSPAPWAEPMCSATQLGPPCHDLQRAGDL